MRWTFRAAMCRRASTSRPGSTVSCPELHGVGCAGLFFQESSFQPLFGGARSPSRMNEEFGSVLTSNIFSNGAARRIELLVDVQRRLSSSSESMEQAPPALELYGRI